MYILCVNVILLFIAGISRSAPPPPEPAQSAPAHSADLDPKNPVAKEKAEIILHALDEQTSHSPRFLSKILSMHQEGANIVTKMELWDRNYYRRRSSRRRKNKCDWGSSSSSSSSDDCSSDSSSSDCSLRCKRRIHSEIDIDPAKKIDSATKVDSATKPKREINREVCDVVCTFDQQNKPHITQHHCVPLAEPLEELLED